ncbi:hypothetical protein AB3M89_06270 [Microbacterium sp. 179-I 3D2 NHS]|uniref:hypothetical protein n=1 Tax=Microbacterium sp. 179-I 3D2 NHS TaxID=3235178 RepID=UPI0039A119FD
MTMDEQQQPELRWAPLPAPPKRTGRIWLIVGLSVAALAIVGVLLFLLIPRADSAGPEPSATPTRSATPSASPSPTPTPTSTAEPTPEPVVTAPPAADPSVEVFRGKVQLWLDDAVRVLDLVADESGPDASPLIDTLRQDAQRLSDSVAPSSIEGAWRSGVAAYAQRLTDLASAASSGASLADAAAAARAEAANLRSIVGL